MRVSIWLCIYDPRPTQIPWSEQRASHPLLCFQIQIANPKGHKIFLLEEKNNQTNLDEYYFKQGSSFAP